jgi:hypothetical protein
MEIFKKISQKIPKNPKKFFLDKQIFGFGFGFWKIKINPTIKRDYFLGKKDFVFGGNRILSLGE